MNKDLFLGLLAIFTAAAVFIKIHALENELESKDAALEEQKLGAALCKSELEAQNAAVLALSLSKESKENEPKIERVKKIYVRDKSCESELKAYKELFK